MRTRFAIVGLLCSAALLGPAGAGAAGPAGLTVTINAPAAYSAGTPFSVSGFVVAYAAAPVVLEVSRGLGGQSVDLLIDGIRSATATTDTSGFYHFTVSFGPSGTSHSLQAVAFRGTLLETASPPAVTAIDRFVTSMTVSPSSASISAGGSVVLHATGEFNDGRTSDVSEQATWTSSDPSVASVSNEPGARGLVTGVSPGTTTITATAGDVSASATITVTS